MCKTKKNKAKQKKPILKILLVINLEIFKQMHVIFHLCMIRIKVLKNESLKDFVTQDKNLYYFSKLMPLFCWYCDFFF